MGLGPVNEDLAHHPKKLLCIWVWTGEPPRPTEKDKRMNQSLSHSQELERYTLVVSYNMITYMVV